MTDRLDAATRVLERADRYVLTVEVGEVRKVFYLKPERAIPSQGRPRIWLVDLEISNQGEGKSSFKRELGDLVGSVSIEVRSAKLRLGPRNLFLGIDLSLTARLLSYEEEKYFNVNVKFEAVQILFGLSFSKIPDSWEGPVSLHPMLNWIVVQVSVRKAATLRGPEV